MEERIHRGHCPGASARQCTNRIAFGQVEFRRAILVLSIAAILVSLSTWGGVAAATAEEMCDPVLRSHDQHPLAYQQRGDRCEGVYVRDVGGSLEIVGLTESFADFDVAQSELLVSWTESGKAPVRLRATSLRRKSYYRFDTVRSPGSSSYRWPTKVLGALGLVRSDLGVIGWTSAELDGNSKAVYLPLAIGVVGQQPTQYSVIVRSDFELSEVYITLSGLNRKEGQPALIDGQALGQGYYPAQRAIRFQIDRPPDPGLYSLEIGVSLSTGGVATTGLIFEQRMTSGDG